MIVKLFSSTLLEHKPENRRSNSYDEAKFSPVTFEEFIVVDRLEGMNIYPDLMGVTI
jgi:hypothetical protein